MMREVIRVAYKKWCNKGGCSWGLGATDTLSGQDPKNVWNTHLNDVALVVPFICS